MAKSEGNGFTPEELLTGNHKLLDRGYSAMTVRFFMLQCHYASTLDFSNEALQAAEKGLDRLMSAVAKVANLPTADAPNPELNVEALYQRCCDAMGDDFNTPVLISVLFDAVKWVNILHDGRQTASADQTAALQTLLHNFVFDVLGLREEATGSGAGDDGMRDGLLDLLVDLRTGAKTNKDWATADAIRDALGQLGITIKDSKDGSSWEIQ
jgi:cysteinyl-tRNA synthetase